MIEELTQEEIFENNKLFLAFMGFEPEYSGEWFIQKDTSRPQDMVHRSQLSSAVCYHSDWTWLMTVVEKIEKEDYGIKMCRKVVEIYRDSTKEVLFHVKEKSRKESLYKALCIFIEWYNNQNKKS
jgi:hypothetical protein